MHDVERCECGREMDSVRFYKGYMCPACEGREELLRRQGCEDLGTYEPRPNCTKNSARCL